MSELATVNVAVSPIEKFEEFLRTKGMRLTQERLLIVQEVFADHEHFDAEQLVGVLKRRKEFRVSRSSVYRTIKLLEEAGLLRKVA
ncbi:MAG: transcriptional repressor, partial [Planctomycetaceae bacterium]